MDNYFENRKLYSKELDDVKIENYLEKRLRNIKVNVNESL